MRTSRTYLMPFVAMLAVATVGCRQDMHDNPRYEPLEASDFFDDGRASRDPVEGTVARGGLRADDHLYRGRVDGELAEQFPFPVTREVLERGQGRFDIYCTPCHDITGRGRGIVVQRGFKQPPSLHDERIAASPPGYIFDVITNGFGVMQDYSAQVTVRDRWAIAAYVKALQLSQSATYADVPKELRGELDAKPDDAQSQKDTHRDSLH